MENENFETQEIKDKIWVDEKANRGISALKFIRNFDYDTLDYLCDFSYSGDYGLMNRINNGDEVNMVKLDCFYENNKITKICAYFEDGDKKLTVTIQGNALLDYLFLSK